MIISAALTTPCSDFHAPMVVLLHHAAIALLLMLSMAPLQADVWIWPFGAASRHAAFSGLFPLLLQLFENPS